MNMLQTLTAIAVVAGVPLTVVLADQPSPDMKPIAEIVEQLEGKGYGPFIEVSFDDGRWEVETYKNDAPYELSVDPRTGNVLSEHRDDAEPRPPRDAQSLSRILHGLVNAGYTNIDDVAFERRYWEVECLRKDGKREIHVNPTTGEIISDRLDD